MFYVGENIFIILTVLSHELDISVYSKFENCKKFIGPECPSITSIILPVL